jgi:hypothetical protein
MAQSHVGGARMIQVRAQLRLGVRVEDGRPRQQLRWWRRRHRSNRHRVTGIALAFRVLSLRGGAPSSTDYWGIQLGVDVDPLVRSCLLGRTRCLCIGVVCLLLLRPGYLDAVGRWGRRRNPLRL